MSQALSQLKQVPQPVKVFLLRSLLLFVGWKLLYLLLLQPANVPDRQLTAFIVACTAKLLSFFYSGAHYVHHTIYTSLGRGIGIEDPCNGLELIVLYCGFIIAMPTVKKNMGRKLAYIIGGIIGIVALNILRCVALAWIEYDHRALFTIYHKYIFNLVVYGAMVLTWIIYCKDKRYVL